MSESEFGKKWDRCMADAVVKLGERLSLADSVRSRAARARTGSRRGQAAACCRPPCALSCGAPTGDRLSVSSGGGDGRAASGGGGGAGPGGAAAPGSGDSADAPAALPVRATRPPARASRPPEPTLQAPRPAGRRLGKEVTGAFLPSPGPRRESLSRGTSSLGSETGDEDDAPSGRTGPELLALD
ncbi:hypothetical protein NN561_013152 [Cricetulus griseus]